MNTNLTRRSFVAASAAAGLTIAGCGSKSSETTQQKELTPITFCLDWTPNTNHTGVYVAQDQGYFADEGLEVTIVQPSDDGAEAMVGTGQAQLGVSFQDYIANALVAGNTTIQAVAAVIQHNTSGIMSRKEDGITSAKAMEDHVYATWELPVEQATIKQVVEADGGDYSKVKMVPNTFDDEVAALKAGGVDTIWVYEGWSVQNAIVQDYPVNYFSFISIDEVFDYYTPVIIANTDFCGQNSDIVKAFLRAVKKGYEFAISSPDDAADILCKAVPELDSALVKQSAAYLAGEYQSDAASWGVIDSKRWAAFYQWLNDNKLVEKPLDVDAGWTMDYLEA